MRRFGCLLLAVFMGACSPAPQEADSGPEYSKEQLQALYYNDLGPASVDVSGYPKVQQKNYKLFLRICGQCHSPARAIHSPVVRREDWKRYIRRMHERGESAGWLGSVPKDSYRKLVDFLAYDSNVRKVDRKAEFEKLAGELKSLFARVQAEKRRLGLKSDREHVRPAPPYVGDKPGH
ncbi:MAG: hypothetical protein V3S11_00075 [Elusimicrobiota bacterium]